jgi:polysaccharide export outer membrane protein
MRKIIFFLILTALAQPVCAGESVETAAPGEPTNTMAEWPRPDYIIGPGDMLSVSVWEVEALTKQVVVLPDGKISYPLIGELTAAGKTISRMRKELEDALTRYVPDPVVTVGVEQVNSMLIYVIGRVNSPGRFLLHTNVNVLQALATAGGLNVFAKRSKIKIFRQEGGKTKIYKFNYDEVSSGEELEQNIVLKRGDVIVVP